MENNASENSLPNRVAHVWPPCQWSGFSVVAAISGGPDSVAMLRAALEMRQQGSGKLILAHFNHRWRGQASDDDAAFVSELGNSLDLPTVIGTAMPANNHLRQNDHGQPAPMASEEQARDERYKFLKQVAYDFGARCVITAHTFDDQAETILLRLLRGTGIGGLAGIPFCRELTPGVSLVRPLLAERRSDVLSYLHSIQQPYRMDSSNSNHEFTRNRIRHELLPQLRASYNVNVDEALVRLGRLAHDTAHIVSGVVSEAMSQAITSTTANEVVLRRATIRTLPIELLRHLLVQLWDDQAWSRGAMTWERWDELAQLLQSSLPIPRQDWPGGIAVTSKLDDVIITCTKRTSERC